MANKVIVNKAMSLQLRDLLRSWVMVILYPVLRTIYELWKKDGSFDNVNWESILVETGFATLLYLADRYFQPAKVITTYDTTDQAEEVAATITPAK